MAWEIIYLLRTARYFLNSCFVFCFFVFLLFRLAAEPKTGTKLNHKAHSCFAFSSQSSSIFIVALKFSQWETYSLRVHDSYKHQFTRSIIWRERHKTAERVAVFMGKRVEKPLLSLICHKVDLWVCAVRLLFGLCIDSSHAHRFHKASHCPYSTSALSANERNCIFILWNLEIYWTLAAFSLQMCAHLCLNYANVKKKKRDNFVIAVFWHAWMTFYELCDAVRPQVEPAVHCSKITKTNHDAPTASCCCLCGFRL